jgi:diguanylate cyclase (GGDEF)-like protein
VDTSPSSSNEHDYASAQATLAHALRPIRILLSVAFLAVVFATPGRQLVSLGAATSLFLAATACANAIANGAVMLGWLRDTTRGRALALQMAADALLALAGMLLLDAAATPLAWIALLLPVFDAGVLLGAFAAGIAWATLSLAYIVLTLQLASPEDSEAGVLGLAIQQLAAVAIVAVPTAYVAARLRDDLAHSHGARVEADRRAEELLLVADAAQRLGAAPGSFEVLDVALASATALGFARADVCQKHDGRPWRLLRAAGSPAGPDPAADPHLDEAVAHERRVTVAMGGSTGEAEDLSLLGFRAGIVLPISHNATYAVALRAWSADPLTEASSEIESLTLLATLTAGAWHNATTLSNLESWSDQLAHQATHDELTGLANRANLFASVQSALDRMETTGTPFAVLFLDLDGFKQVNDELGHEAGDAVLQGIAERLRRQVRGHDVLARLGGDEFVVVLNELASPSYALTIASRLCESAAAPFSIGHSIVTLAASVGVAHARPGDTADRLLNTADRVMYEAKRSGGNQFVVSEPGAA